jgi:hypothetical protein
MNKSAWSSRLASAASVAAVSIAALGAAGSDWAARHEPAQAGRATLRAQRPAADAPVQVVKAPGATAARRQPASCPDCAAPRNSRRSL